MRVLTIYAHHNPHSLCHAILEKFEAGLREAGHENETIDLHAIGFDPVLRSADGPNWIDESVPDDVLANMNVKSSLIMSAGGPLRRMLARLWVGNRNARQIIQKLRSAGGPSDVKAQQEKIARAEALAIISPVYFVGFPAILKGWIDRVFSLGFAFGFTPEAWRGDISGRLPLFKHKKALIISTTIFDKKSYENNGMHAAMKVLIDDYMFRFPGIESVEHKYFHAVYGADAAARKAFLEEAFQLGRNF